MSRKLQSYKICWTLQWEQKKNKGDEILKPQSICDYKNTMGNDNKSDHWNYRIHYIRKNTMLEFRMKVTVTIFKKYVQALPWHVQGDSSITLMEKARPIPHTSKSNKEETTQKSCFSRRSADGKKMRKGARTWCEDCNVGLRMKHCFKMYHTQKIINKFLNAIFAKRYLKLQFFGYFVIFFITILTNILYIK